MVLIRQLDELLVDVETIAESSPYPNMT